MNTVKLYNGVEIPWIGLGVFRLEENGQVEKAVLNALRNGYRMIDTANVYHNEKGVGKAIKMSGIPRKQIILSSKVGNKQQGYESTKITFYDSLEALQTDYLDIYLIHWPQGMLTLETWRAMEELYQEGLIRAIGVSNFDIHHLQFLLSNSNIIPAVNQIEFHPRHWSEKLYAYCMEKKIRVMAWSPLMLGKATRISEIRNMALKYNKTPAQIILRWNLQKKVVTIPKSGKPQHIAENMKIFDFELSERDLVKIDKLNRNESLIKKRDRIIYLLQMLWKLKFNKTLYRLLVSAIYNRVAAEFKTAFGLSPAYNTSMK